MADLSAFSSASRHLIETPPQFFDVTTYQTKVLKRTHELEQEILALKRSFNKANPIHRLPVEILTTIFSFISKSPTGNEILNTCHVCAYWRTVVLGCPYLWAELRGSCLRSVKLMEVMLEKSGKAPLAVWSPEWPMEERAVDHDALSVALSNIDRLKSVSLCSPGEYDDEVVDLPLVLSGWTKARANVLEKLCIMNIVDDHYYSCDLCLPILSDLEEFHLADGLLGGGAPALHDLTLSHVGLRWENMPLGGSLVRLRLLEDTRFGDRFRPTEAEFAQYLKQMPQLQVLELHGLLPRLGDLEIHRGEACVFPATLKSLGVTDRSTFLARLFEMASIPDYMSVTIAFIQDAIRPQDLDLVLKKLKSSLSRKRASLGVQSLVKRSFTTSFSLRFSSPRTQADEMVPVDCIGEISVNGAVSSSTPRLTTIEYYSALARHFDFSTLRSAHYLGFIVRPRDDYQWKLFRNLRCLQAITLSYLDFQLFFDQLKSDPMLSSTRAPEGEELCYFPSLTTINCGSRLFLGPDGSQKEEFLKSLAELFNARRLLGAPLQNLLLAASDLGDEDVVRLQEAVPGLVLGESVSDPT